MPLLKMIFDKISLDIKHYLGVINSRRYRHQTNLKINLGCGAAIKKDWVNIDQCAGADLTLDLRKKVPFEDNSCSVIYSEHFLEHLEYPLKAQSFLTECYRVLKPGGMISLGVPDTEWPLQAYCGSGDASYFESAKELWHPKWCATRREHINFHVRQNENGQHKFAYDFETLEYILKKCHFGDVKRRNFDSNLDCKDRELGTLYVDAIKPAQPILA